MADRLNWSDHEAGDGSTPETRIDPAELNELRDKFNRHADDIEAIEPGADVTDADNVAAAGAAMKANNLSDVSAPESRTNLGLEIGVDVQAYDAVLDATEAAYTSTDKGKVDNVTVSAPVNLDSIDARVNLLDASVVLQGEWDASGGTFPASAMAGYSWIVSTGGTVDSEAFAANDRLIALVDGASTTTFAGNWFKADYTGDVISVNGRTGLVTGVLDAANNLSEIANVNAARANLGVDPAGTDNSTPLQLVGTGNYLVLNGQTLTQNPIVITESQISDLKNYLTDLTTTSIGALLDVLIVNPAVGQILKFDGTRFVNAEDSDGGVGATNLFWNAATKTISSDTGNNAILTDVDDTNSGLMTTIQKQLLDQLSTNDSVQDAAILLNTAKRTYPAADETKVGHLTVNQPVDLDAIETRVNGLDAAVVLQGTWDASAGMFPGSGTAQAGDSWIVSFAGTVNGEVFNVDDRVIAITDNASTTVYTGNWHKADYTDQAPDSARSLISTNSLQNSVISTALKQLEDTEAKYVYFTTNRASADALIQAPYKNIGTGVIHLNGTQELWDGAAWVAPSEDLYLGVVGMFGDLTALEHQTRIAADGHYQIPYKQVNSAAEAMAGVGLRVEYTETTVFALSDMPPGGFYARYNVNNGDATFTFPEGLPVNYPIDWIVPAYTPTEQVTWIINDGQTETLNDANNNPPTDGSGARHLKAIAGHVAWYKADSNNWTQEKAVPYSNYAGVGSIEAPLHIASATTAEVKIVTNNGADYEIDWGEGDGYETYSSGATVSKVLTQARDPIFKFVPGRAPIQVDFTAGAWSFTPLQFDAFNGNRLLNRFRMDSGVGTGFMGNINAFFPAPQSLTYFHWGPLASSITGDLDIFVESCADLDTLYLFNNMSGVTATAEGLSDASLSFTVLWLTSLTISGDINALVAKHTGLATLHIESPLNTTTADIFTIYASCPNLSQLRLQSENTTYVCSDLPVPNVAQQRIEVQGNVLRADLDRLLEGIATTVTSWSGAASVDISDYGNITPGPTSMGTHIPAIEAQTGTPTVAITFTDLLSIPLTVAVGAAGNTTINIITTDSGTYDVDWGAGPVTVASGVDASHDYAGAGGTATLIFSAGQAPTELELDGINWSTSAAELVALNANNLLVKITSQAAVGISGALDTIVAVNSPLAYWDVDTTSASTLDMELFAAKTPLLTHFISSTALITYTGDLDSATANWPAFIYLSIYNANASSTATGTLDVMASNIPNCDFLYLRTHFSLTGALLSAINTMTLSTQFYLFDQSGGTKYIFTDTDLGGMDLTNKIVSNNFALYNVPNITVSSVFTPHTAMALFFIYNADMTTASVDKTLESLVGVTTWGGSKQVSVDLNASPGIDSLNTHIPAIEAATGSPTVTTAFVELTSIPLTVGTHDTGSTTLRVTTSDGGDYTVNWGFGDVTASSGVDELYDYAQSGGTATLTFGPLQAPTKIEFRGKSFTPTAAEIAALNANNLLDRVVFNGTTTRPSGALDTIVKADSPLTYFELVNTSGTSSFDMDAFCSKTPAMNYFKINDTDIDVSGDLGTATANWSTCTNFYLSNNNASSTATGDIGAMGANMPLCDTFVVISQYALTGNLVTAINAMNLAARFYLGQSVPSAYTLTDVDLVTLDLTGKAPDFTLIDLDTVTASGTFTPNASTIVFKVANCNLTRAYVDYILETLATVAAWTGTKLAHVGAGNNASPGAASLNTHIPAIEAATGSPTVTTAFVELTSIDITVGTNGTADTTLDIVTSDGNDYIVNWGFGDVTAASDASVSYAYAGSGGTATIKFDPQQAPLEVRLWGESWAPTATQLAALNANNLMTLLSLSSTTTRPSGALDTIVQADSPLRYLKISGAEDGGATTLDIAALAAKTPLMDYFHTATSMLDISGDLGTGTANWPLCLYFYINNNNADSTATGDIGVMGANMPLCDYFLVISRYALTGALMAGIDSMSLLTRFYLHDATGTAYNFTDADLVGQDFSSKYNISFYDVHDLSCTGTFTPAPASNTFVCNDCSLSVTDIDYILESLAGATSWVALKIINVGSNVPPGSASLADNGWIEQIHTVDAAVAITRDTVLTTSGLVAHYDPEVGVDGTSPITAVADQSAEGNDLVNAGTPTLVADELNGYDVFDFNGVTDALELLSGVTGLPTGAADRTMFMVVNYRSTGAWAGLVYGTAAANQTFGLVQAADGILSIQGWGAGNDFGTPISGPAEGWLLQSVRLNSNAMGHHMDGVLIDGDTHTFGTVNGRIALGAEIDGTPTGDMQIGLVLIYDRALTDDEYSQTHDFIALKYGLPSV